MMVITFSLKFILFVYNNMFTYNTISLHTDHFEKQKKRDSEESLLTFVKLRCGPWARQFYPSLLLVQSMKTRPCLTERLLMGRKESNQTIKTFVNLFPSYSILDIQ